MPRRPFLLVGTVLTALTALVALGCSSEDEPLTAEQAAAVAAAGLLTEEDLPNAEWTVTEGEGAEDAEEDIGDTDDLFASTESCQDLQAAIEELFGTEEEAEETPSLAEATRTFDFGGDDQLVLRSVEASVSVPADPAEVEAGFEALREVMNADAVRPCFESAFTESLSGGEDMGVTISSLEVTEPAKITDDAIAIAIDLEAIAVIIPINMHMEMHFWPEGPAVGELMFMELNSDLLKDNAPEILEAARTRLAEAVEANK
jgi:hypothetical protein